MLVTIARFSFPYEAHLARGRLESAGIPAFVADEHTINMQWLYSDAMGGVRLQVPTAYTEQAQAVLAEDLETELVEQQGVDNQPCPHCGSEDTEFYALGRRWAFLMFLALKFPLFPVRSGIRCKACGKVSAQP